jgi:hypothetical protein
VVRACTEAYQGRYLTGELGSPTTDQAWPESRLGEFFFGVQGTVINLVATAVGDRVPGPVLRCNQRREEHRQHGEKTPSTTPNLPDTIRRPSDTCDDPGLPPGNFANLTRPTSRPSLDLAGFPARQPRESRLSSALRHRRSTVSGTENDMIIEGRRIVAASETRRRKFVLRHRAKCAKLESSHNRPRVDLAVQVAAAPRRRQDRPNSPWHEK